MTRSPIDPLLQQLIQCIIGIEESSALEFRLEQAKSILKNHRSSSTEEHLIDEIYSNLADKFMIKGHDDLAQDLTHSKNTYSNKLKKANAQQRILSYDMLSLLLSLSDSPLKQTHERKRQRLEERRQRIEDWNDLLREEPMEGSHWQSWSDIPSEEDDEDWDEPSTYQRHSPPLPASRTPILSTDYLQQLKSFHEPIADATTRLERLKSQQYWTRAATTETDFRLPESILHDPIHLNVALREAQLGSNGSGERRYMKEIDAMREVLFLMRGYKTIVFRRVRNDAGSLADKIFYFDSSYSLHHLSDQSFKGIMDMFCHHASILYKLKRHAKRTVFVRRNGQVYQSFSVAISTALNTFEGFVAELEAKCMSKYTSDPNGIISLLQLQDTLQNHFLCFGAIFDTLIHCSTLVSSSPSPANARSVATFLLAALFNRTTSAQMAGNSLIYQMLLSVFSQTMVPYSRLLDDWIWNGSLDGDVAGEFFVRRNKTVDNSSPQYWCDGFYIDGVETNTPDCPLFTLDFTNRILLTGKTADVVNKIIPVKYRQDTVQQVSFESIFRKHFQLNPVQHTYGNRNDRPVDSTTTNDPHKNLTEPVNPFIRFGVPHLDQPLDTLLPVDTSTKKHLPDLLTLFKYAFEDCLRIYIDDLHKVSAKMLLHTLRQHACIPTHLQSLSNIYLMLDNDLMHTFCENVFIQMDKKQRWYDHSFINQAFTEACQTSRSQTDMALVNLKMELIKYDVNESRKTSLPSGYKAPTIATYLAQINIDYQIPWPTNNFIKPDTMKYYNQLVHLLFRIKRAKYILDKKTLLIKCTDMIPATVDYQDSGVTRLYSLRMRMVWFVNAFWRYVMTTVLHSDTKLFREKLAKIQDANEIPILHESYLKQIIDKCLLNEQSVSIKKAIIHVMDMAEQLADLFMDTDMGALEALELDYMRTSEFIATSLSIMGRKGSLEWFDVLSAALSV